ncbi:MAG TPA: hypothetical protein VMQ40_00200, partial [Acidimicrobiales bacterium]|nr:hypothetical protein [Acidimicrobiales bacterium]
MTTACPPPRRERAPEVARRLTAVVTLVGVLVGLLASPAASNGILPGANPGRNITPDPNFVAPGSCTHSSSGWRCTNPCVLSSLSFPSYTNAPRCTAFVLRAINGARRREGVAPMTLPRDFKRLSVPEQLFVLADLERTARGLPPYLGLNLALTREAQHSANLGGDPSLAPGFAVGVDKQGYDGMGGTWSSGFSPLIADYFWMYDDGWGGSAARTFNSACSSAGASACWAHRDQLLGYDPRFNPGVGLHCRSCEMGTGFSLAGSSSSFVDLIELPARTPPAMTFTWARNVLPYFATHVRPHRVAHRAHRRVNTRAAARRAARKAAWHLWPTTFSSPRTCAARHLQHSRRPLACRSTTFTVRQVAV